MYWHTYSSVPEQGHKGHGEKKTLGMCQELGSALETEPTLESQVRKVQRKLHLKAKKRYHGLSTPLKDKRTCWLQQSDCRCLDNPSTHATTKPDAKPDAKFRAFRFPSLDYRQHASMAGILLWKLAQRRNAQCQRYSQWKSPQPVCSPFTWQLLVITSLSPAIGSSCLGTVCSDLKWIGVEMVARLCLKWTRL